MRLLSGYSQFETLTRGVRSPKGRPLIIQLGAKRQKRIRRQCATGSRRRQLLGKGRARRG